MNILDRIDLYIKETKNKCPEGQYWCSIQKKCVPKGTGKKNSYNEKLDSMEFKQYLDESLLSMSKSLLISLSKTPYDKSKILLKDNFNKMIKMIKDNGIENEFLNIINKNLKTNYKSLNDISKLKENILNEDFSNFWKMFKLEGWGAVAIFPTLSIWFEIDKLLDGIPVADLNFKKIVIYGTFWLMLLLGKHIQGYKRWKKDHPDEYESEGKPGIFKKGSI